jgi:hypothetical protein
MSSHIADVVVRGKPQVKPRCSVLRRHGPMGQ